MIRSAVAVWKGSPVVGEGLVSTTSGVISNALYAGAGSVTSEEPCTTPSEMLAAAVASCTSLMLARETARTGVKPDQVKTEAVVSVEQKKGQWEVTKIEVHVTASLPDVDEEEFHKICRNAKKHCLISRSLNVPIFMTSKLETHDAVTV
ncbi:MAG TPA: OsmC family peroxiredoxin [Terriglobales bacterium]|nr:OsmC family peroxiredoxin [Terriglobales bacterium]